LDWGRPSRYDPRFSPRRNVLMLMAVSTLALLLALAGDSPSQGAPKPGQGAPPGNQSQGNQPGGPIRVLCLLGGEHHLYEKNMTALVNEVSRLVPIRAEMVRIDHPPDGYPKAEKATIASNQAI